MASGEEEKISFVKKLDIRGMWVYSLFFSSLICKGRRTVKFTGKNVSVSFANREAHS